MGCILRWSIEAHIIMGNALVDWGKVLLKEIYE